MKSLQISRFFFVFIGLAAFMASCDNDSSNKGNTSSNKIEPECMTSSDCADREDGKLECDTKANICVKSLVGIPQESCGNDSLEAGESCDKTNLNGKTCTDWPEYIGGELACNKLCEFDKSGCYSCSDTDTSKCTKEQKCSSGKCVGLNHTAECGDGVIEDDEKCDTNDLNFKTCADFGFLSGDLKCKSCDFDTSECNSCTQNEQCGDDKICFEGKCDVVPECGEHYTYIEKYNVCAYKVNNEDEWMAIVNDWSENGEKNYVVQEGKHASFILMNDLHLTDNSLHGLHPDVFSGVFLGNGKTVTIDTVTSLVQTATDAVFENLNVIVNVDYVSGAYSPVSITCNNTIYNNVHVSGTINAGSMAAGVVMYSNNCSFDDVSFSGQVNANKMGGIVAQGNGSFNNINVDVTNSADYGDGDTGGLLGLLTVNTKDTVGYATVKDSNISFKRVNHWSSQTTNTNGLNMGGLIGYAGAVKKEVHLEVENTQVNSILDVDIKMSTYSEAGHKVFSNAATFGGLLGGGAANAKLKNLTISLDASVKVQSAYDDDPSKLKLYSYVGGIVGSGNYVEAENVKVNISKMDSLPDIKDSDYHNITHKGLVIAQNYTSAFRNISIHLNTSSIDGSSPYIASAIEKTHMSNISVNSDYPGTVILGNGWWLNNIVTNVNVDELTTLTSDSKNNELDTIVYKTIAESPRYKIQNSSVYESAAKTVEIMNNSLASKNPKLAEGKYFPWIVNGDGKAELNLDAPESEMYTIP